MNLYNTLLRARSPTVTVLPLLQGCMFVCAIPSISAALWSHVIGKRMAAPDEVAVHVRVDEHAGTPGEEAHLTEGEDDVVLNKLAEGIFGLLGPAVNEIDDRVADVR